MTNDIDDRLAALELASAAQKAALRILIAALVSNGTLEPGTWDGALEELAADLSDKEQMVDRKLSIIEAVRAFEAPAPSFHPSEETPTEDARVEDGATST